MPLLIIVRHGQSTWNLENRFTGDVDVDLTPQGEQEAQHAGQLLKPYKFTKAHTSVLRRAIRTLEIILNECGTPDLPVARSGALNERFYGDLQGLNKSETEERYGVEQVHVWRRSYDVAPPNGESLKDTYDRVVRYYKTEVETELKNDSNILIVAHGNSLRALMMYLENISPEEIANLNLATGAPRIYEMNKKLAVLKSFYIE